jgi:hypothetical protein
VATACHSFTATLKRAVGGDTERLPQAVERLVANGAEVRRINEEYPHRSQGRQAGNLKRNL